MIQEPAEPFLAGDRSCRRLRTTLDSSGGAGVVRPAWAVVRGWESPRDLVAGTEVNRKATDREDGAEGSGVAKSLSRRTEIGYEALWTRASGPLTAKLLRPRGSGVDPAVVRRRPPFLFGEISLCA
jgi:hypothetical protein